MNGEQFHVDDDYQILSIMFLISHWPIFRTRLANDSTDSARLFSIYEVKVNNVERVS